VRSGLAALLVAATWPAHAGAADGPAALPKPASVVDKGRATPAAADTSLWYDLRELEIEGKGWEDTAHFYDRLPARARALVREAVWDLSLRSAGLCARFVTDATAIKVRWTLRMERLGSEHMPASGVSGLDLYVRDERGGWGWLAQARPSQYPTNERALVDGLPSGWHEFLLYLPLYNGVESVAIGLPPGASLAKASPRPAGHRRPIVFYGTSITQGGVASRPGMAYTAILGRRLDRPVINLGFSGNGPMELEIGRLMGELEAAVFVIDCLPNMDPAQVKDRALPFVRLLRQARPDTPIVLVENITYQGSRYVQERRERSRAKNVELESAFRELAAGGARALFYIPGAGLLGDDDEATVDGTHPSDLGFMRMADAMEPVLRQAVAAASGDGR